jgi:hypothetical protein
MTVVLSEEEEEREALEEARLEDAVMGLMLMLLDVLLLLLASLGASLEPGNGISLLLSLVDILTAKISCREEGRVVEGDGLKDHGVWSSPLSTYTFDNKAEVAKYFVASTGSLCFALSLSRCRWKCRSRCIGEF